MLPSQQCPMKSSTVRVAAAGERERERERKRAREKEKKQWERRGERKHRKGEKE